jgi:MFS family permease
MLARSMAVLRRVAELRASLPREFWTIWVGTLINRCGGFAAPLLAFYLTQSRGFTLSEAGAVVALYGAGSVAASLTGGVLADRVGRRATMAVSLLGGSVVMVALGFAQTPRAIAALVLALGFSSDLYRPAAAAFVADVVPPEQRLRAFGLLHWVINVGFSIAPLAAGLIAGYSYLALFLGNAAAMALYGAIVLTRLPETRPRWDPAKDGARVGLGDVLSHGAFMAFAALTFVQGVIIFQHNVTLPGWMSSQGHGARVFGAVIALNGAVIVLLQPFIVERLRGVRPARVLAAAALLTGLGFSLHGLGSSLALHALAVVIWTFGEIAATPATAVSVASMASAHAQGRYQGVLTLAMGLASFTGPLLGPRVLEAGGPAALWGGCLLLGALAAAGFLATSRAPSIPLARAEPAAAPRAAE